MKVQLSGSIDLGDRTLCIGQPYMFQDIRSCYALLYIWLQHQLYQLFHFIAQLIHNFG